MAIYPTPQQIETLLASPADQPVVMVNLLRFKRRADGADEGVSGEEAYRRYAEAMRAFVESKGGRFLWVGRVDSQVIGTGGEGFHMIGLVKYPSRAAFVAIATERTCRRSGCTGRRGWRVSGCSQRPRSEACTLAAPGYGKTRVVRPCAGNLPLVTEGRRAHRRDGQRAGRDEGRIPPSCALSSSETAHVKSAAAAWWRPSVPGRPTTRISRSLCRPVPCPRLDA
jgi:uncharacterized protein (DUF1330 family)